MESESVARFLGSLGPAEPARAHARIPQPCILLSRQAGARGHTLAAELMRRFSNRGEPLFRGWQVLDEELIRGLADDPRVKVRLESLLDEGFRSGLEDWLAHLIAGTALQDDIMWRLFKFMRQAAEVGKCVIVGRGGGFLLRGHPGAISARLMAPKDIRVLRVQEAKGLDLAGATRWVMRRDAERAGLIRRYFAADIDDPLHYDLVINTALLPVADAAAAIERLVEAAALRLEREPAAF